MVKIGYTSGAVRERIRGLQCGCPVELVLNFTMHGDPDTEATLHEIFSPRIVRGEWFGISKAEAVRMAMMGDGGDMKPASYDELIEYDWKDNRGLLDCSAVNSMRDVRTERIPEIGIEQLGPPKNARRHWIDELSTQEASR